MTRLPRAVYRVLLHGLPRSFREEYGEPMVDAFDELRRARTHPSEAWALFTLVTVDLVATFWREWREVVMSNWNWKAVVARLSGATAIAGSMTWFVVFFGPQWGFLAWGYRPSAIMLGATLLAAGVLGEAFVKSGQWTALRRTSSAALLLSIMLIGVQAPLDVPFAGGVSFDTSQDAPVQGLGVYCLPIAVSLLVLARGSEQSRRRLAAMTAGVIALVLAIALLFPPQTGWFDLWDFVYRHAYLLAALVMVGWSGYRLIGGPIPVVTWRKTSGLQGATSARL